jgi:hypothetical protein
MTGDFIQSLKARLAALGDTDGLAAAAAATRAVPTARV